MGLDLSSIAQEIAKSLPLSARWMAKSTPMEFDFSAGQSGLRELMSLEADFGNTAPQQFLVFGNCDYSEGGGANPWLCIRKSDGWVCGFDLERESEVFVFNSSIERFILTFGLLNRYLGTNVPSLLPTRCESDIEQIDFQAYPTSEWKMLIEYVLDV